jgi:small subunit ribosomal protein S7
MAKKYLSTKNKNLYNKIINFFTKKGNKVKATNLVNGAFDKVSKSTGLSFNAILTKLYLKLNSFVEIKKIKVRRGFHLVPFPISHKRSTYLMIKWLLQAIKNDNRKVPVSDKLFLEINQTISSSSSKSLDIKNSNITQVLANRSNIHFRW